MKEGKNGGDGGFFFVFGAQFFLLFFCVFVFFVFFFVFFCVFVFFSIELLFFVSGNRFFFLGGFFSPSSPKKERYFFLVTWFAFFLVSFVKTSVFFLNCFLNRRTTGVKCKTEDKREKKMKKLIVQALVDAGTDTLWEKKM